jgi:hypothetical protein
MVEPTANLNPKKGVRVKEHRIQFGLEEEEIEDLEERLEELLQDVDSGKIKVQ